MGLEPMTLRLKVWCSTDWANRAAHIESQAKFGACNGFNLAYANSENYAKNNLRWLDTVFQGLSINYVAINNDLDEIATTVVLDKDENLKWSGLQWHRSCRRNEMTPLLMTLAAISPHWEMFFQNRLPEHFPPTAASMFVQFRRNL